MTITTVNSGAAATAPAAPAENAPAAAPAAPVATSLDDATPAPAAAPAAPPAVPGAAEAVEYEPTGNAGLDVALNYLGKLGISATDPAMAAAEKGDFSILRAKLASMGDKAPGWEQMLKLGEESFAGIKAGRDAEAAKTTDAILSVFGEDKEVAGRDWAKVRDWAKANAEPAERTAVNAALAAGGIAAKAMASYLKGLYLTSPDAQRDPAPTSKVGGRAATGTDALSPRAYAAEVQALRGRIGTVEGTAEYATLQARRAAWRG